MNFELLQPVILAMTQERSCRRVMEIIVDGLTRGTDRFALARIWVKGPGDRCDHCPFRDVCSDKRECLHLTASDGHSSSDSGREWKNIEGEFARFPIGHRKIGHIGATGNPILITNIQEDSQWMVDRNWAAAEGIKSFAGHPLIFRGEVLGVLGIFCREGIHQTGFKHLRTFANQAAIAIANASAFEEINRLRGELEAENAQLKQEFLEVDTEGEMVGSSELLKRLLEQIELVAPTDATILIQGESGSGKELVARAIHRRSRRKDKPLVKVNCAAIPNELFESEFFGHVKGAFTGAVRDRVGRFQLADRGTLFLDEVGEIPLGLQSKLLRVLQEGEFERIGEASTRKVNVRVVAATNRNLKDEVKAGKFREDLYYRLSVFPVQTPPLRERKGDIPALVGHFLEAACQRLGVEIPRISIKELESLSTYDWPGNIRELSHVVERCAIVSRGGKADFSFVFKKDTVIPVAPQAITAEGVHPENEMRDAQIENIRQALRAAKGKVYGKGGAAEMLGVSPSTLTSRIRRWKIK